MRKLFALSMSEMPLLGIWVAKHWKYISGNILAEYAKPPQSANS